MKKHVRQVLLILVLIGLTTPLLADVRRSFAGDRPVGVLVREMLEAFGRRGLKFEIQKVYDAKSDGRHGIVLKLKPQGTLATILFVEKGEKAAIFHLAVQDYADANRLGQILTSDLKMSEIGLGPDTAESAPNTWPVGPLR